MSKQSNLCVFLRHKCRDKFISEDGWVNKKLVESFFKKDIDWDNVLNEHYDQTETQVRSRMGHSILKVNTSLILKEWKDHPKYGYISKNSLEHYKRTPIERDSLVFKVREEDLHPDGGYFKVDLALFGVVLKCSEMLAVIWIGRDKKKNMEIYNKISHCSEL